jgi:hypothetical protein
MPSFTGDMAARGWLVAAVVLVACSGKGPLATLTKAEGPTAKQAKDDKAPWTDAPVGTKFFLGDAVQTADGGAELALGKSARIAMQPHTLLRFGRGKDNAAEISVTAGAIDLIGGGSYSFDIGNVHLTQNGAIRITSTGVAGQSTFEVRIGQAQVTFADGKTLDLVLNGAVTLDVAKPGPPELDAGIADAPAAVAEDAGIDAPAETSDEIAIHVEGTGTEHLLPGEKKWQKLAPGDAAVAKGERFRLGRTAKARLTAHGMQLELGGGAHVLVDDTAMFVLESGNASAMVAPSGEGTVKVPGGPITVKGTADGGGETRIENRGSDTKIADQRGKTAIHGKDGDLDLERGESATLKSNGRIVREAVIPNYFDLRVTAGDPTNFFIHDHTGATAVQFLLTSKCPTGGVVELDTDAKFTAPRLSAGKDAANILVKKGSWNYRVRCTQGGKEGPAVVQGRVKVDSDDGQRPIVPPNVIPIDADGRPYDIGFQSSIPDIKIRGTGTTLHLATGGTEQTFPVANGSVTVAGSKLKEAVYTFWIESAAGAKTKVSTLKFTYDQTAPKVYIRAPANGATWGPSIEVKGDVLPGWTAKIDAADIPIDKSTRRFVATVEPPAGKALAIRLSNSRGGIHFYLRRGAK